MTAAGRIRVGVGGWNFEPWRGTFYPDDVPQSRELHYASRHLGAIEINSTYYGSQKPATFAKWRNDTPDDFVFSIKASRFATNRRVLAEGGPSIERFIHSGIAELGPKLGPIVWQFAPTKSFDAAEFGAFLGLLPSEVDGVRLQHALDVRHASFMCAEYMQLARRHKCATVFTDSDDYPSFADLSAGFAYARLMRTESRFKDGVAPLALDAWAERARCWRDGGEPSDLPRVEPLAKTNVKEGAARDVFLYFISGAKEKAPAAALALLKRLSG